MPTAIIFNATATPSSGAAPLTVNFTASATRLGSNVLSSVAWTFGDGGTSTATNPTYVYTTPGTYTASCLISYSFSGITGTSPPVYPGGFTNNITVTGVTASASFTFSPSSPNALQSINFTDTSTGATSWSWNFGDGNTSTLQNPSHTYSSPNTYTVTLSINGGASTTSQSIVVNHASSSIAISSSTNPEAYGLNVILYGTISSTSATGSVTYYNGASNMGTSVVGSGGVSALSTTTLPVGTNSITAHYSGDGIYSSSTSSIFSQTITQYPTSTNLTSSSNPTTLDSSTTFTATVIGQLPTGTVTFYNGGISLGTSSLSAGVATLSTSSLSIGNHSITAHYSGDTNNTSSISSIVTQTVTNGRVILNGVIMDGIIL